MKEDQPSAEEVVRLLGLTAHPEGGFYRETFRAPASSASGAGRAASTAIYFLLPEETVSAWHRVDADEVWHHYAGAPLELILAEEGGPRSSVRLGKDLAAGERPQAVVPAGVWQMARPLGGWTLTGCTVAPAFEFAGFEMAPPGWEPGQEPG